MVQRITFISKEEMPIHFTCSLDSNAIQWGKDCYWNHQDEWCNEKEAGLFVKTLTTEQTLLSLMKVDFVPAIQKAEKTIKSDFYL